MRVAGRNEVGNISLQLIEGFVRGGCASTTPAIPIK
jgi:hypothetical protein